MPYIPKEHKKYNLLPYCREKGGEVFAYPAGPLYEAERLIGSPEAIFPYGFDSYEDYFRALDEQIAAHEAAPDIAEKLIRLRDRIRQMNQKEEWSVLRYTGPTLDVLSGLTNGRNYYWPTSKAEPVYGGVIDNEEFTAYLYPTEANLWEILEDPTGMAYRTVYTDGKGRLTKAAYETMMGAVESGLAPRKA
ncbi:MAG: hypothetical protein HFE86_07420 [Clostridiales bacterium]|nr:hypothetical protein [Clostridiales bacterium]